MRAVLGSASAGMHRRCTWVASSLWICWAPVQNTAQSIPNLWHGQPSVRVFSSCNSSSPSALSKSPHSLGNDAPQLPVQLCLPFVHVGCSALHLSQPHLAPGSKLKSACVQPGHAWLTQHYKWGLDRVFFRGNHSHVIIIEDDMLFSPDFLTLFEATAPLLEHDPSLWCVSSWNDNGLASFAWNASRLVSSSPRRRMPSLSKPELLQVARLLDASMKRLHTVYPDTGLESRNLLVLSCLLLASRTSGLAAGMACSARRTPRMHPEVLRHAPCEAAACHALLQCLCTEASQACIKPFLLACSLVSLGSIDEADPSCSSPHQQKGWCHHLVQACAG